MSTTRNILNLVFWSLALLIGPYIFSSSRAGGLGGLSIFGFDVPAWLYYVVGGLLWLQSLASLIGSRREGVQQTGLTAPGGGHNSPNQVEPTITSATGLPVAPNGELSLIAESSGSTTDAPNKLSAYVAQMREVDDERVNELLLGLQDRMAYKREAALNEIEREKLTDPRIVGAVKILATSDRVDTIRKIAQRVLDSLDLGELRNDTGEEPAAMPATIPSPPAVSTNPSGARSHQTTPRLLILLVDKMPPGGPESHIRRLLNDLSAQEIPEDVVLRVTDSYADQGYIAANMMFTPVQQGIRADDNKTWYCSYSTADGITGTQVFIYE